MAQVSRIAHSYAGHAIRRIVRWAAVWLFGGCGSLHKLKPMDRLRFRVVVRPARMRACASA
eukprot:2759484-Lingulodinium_polyedra.AAC.1